MLPGSGIADGFCKTGDSCVFAGGAARCVENIYACEAAGSWCSQGLPFGLWGGLRIVLLNNLILPRVLPRLRTDPRNFCRQLVEEFPKSLCRSVLWIVAGGRQSNTW